METMNQEIAGGQIDTSKLEIDEKRQASTVGYIIGNITIDNDGIWRFYYVGPHNVAGKRYFGNGVVALRNIRELFDVVGSRLNKVKEIYVDKILDLEKEKSDDTTPAKDTSST